MQASTVLGLLAASCTTVAYFPQIQKCRETGSARDLSLGTFSILTIGIALWIVYGLLQHDAILVLANSVSLACLLVILYFRIANG